MFVLFVFSLCFSSGVDLIYIRENNGSVSELVILVANGEEFVLMNFTGKIDLKKIAKLTNTVSIGESNIWIK